MSARAGGSRLLVVLGMMGRCPFGGQTWLYLNWLRGLARLGHDVYYVEDDNVWPYDPRAETLTDDCSYAVEHIARNMDAIGLAGRWAFTTFGDHVQSPAEAHDEVALADEPVLVEIGDRIDDRERHDEAGGDE